LPNPTTTAQPEALSGLIERVTFFNEENGWAVFKVKAAKKSRPKKEPDQPNLNLLTYALSYFLRPLHGTPEPGRDARAAASGYVGGFQPFSFISGCPTGSSALCPPNSDLQFQPFLHHPYRIAHTQGHCTSRR
jgi:hypothetical protein